MIINKKTVAKSEKQVEREKVGIMSDDEKLKVSDLITKFALNKKIELCLDEKGEPYVVLPKRRTVAFPIRSSTFRRWLQSQWYRLEKKGFSGDIFNEVVANLEARAFHLKNTRELYNRVARVGDIIYYDIGDDKQVVKITKKGWKVTKTSPVLFRRFTHQKVQVLPKKGRLEGVLDFLNIKKGADENQNDQLLFVTYLVAVLIPDIPRALIICVGEQGAGKSFALRIARSLLDPSRTELLKLRSSQDELAQMADHHYCLYLDNLSYLSNDSSDSLSSFVTGVGFSKRKLFSDQEDIIFNLKVAVGITGILLVADKPDLLDRCLIFELERIPKNKREKEENFFKEFNARKPEILGGLFSTLSRVLAIQKGINLEEKPRMADYAHYAVAAAKALGYSEQTFLDAFEGNVKRQNQAAVDASPVAQVILEFMEDKEEYENSSSKLYETLKQIAEKRKIKIGGSRGFPKSSTWLWRKIMEVKSNLSALGIEAELDTSNTAHSEIKLINPKKEDVPSRKEKNASNATLPPEQAQKEQEAEKKMPPDASSDASTKKTSAKNASTKRAMPLDASTTNSLKMEAEETMEANPAYSEGKGKAEARSENTSKPSLEELKKQHSDKERKLGFLEGTDLYPQKLKEYEKLTEKIRNLEGVKMT